MANGYHEKFDPVLSEELAFVEQRWRAKERRRSVPEGEISFDARQMRGLALSGGGIRSASFCMGVVQKLQVEGVIDRLHYMSTVSGGGYTGCALTWFMTQPRSPGAFFGTAEGDFPFTGGAPVGRRNAAPSISPAPDGGPPKIDAAESPEAAATEPPKPEPLSGRAVLDYIRQRSSYLDPGSGFTLVSALAIVLRSVVVALLGFVLLLALLFVPLLAFGLFGLTIGGLPGWLAWLEGMTLPVFGGTVLLLGLGLTIVVYSLLTGLPWLANSAYSLRRGYQKAAGSVLAVALLLFALHLLMLLITYIATTGLPLVGKDVTMFAAGAGGLGVIGGLLVRALAVLPAGLAGRIAMAVIPPLALVLLLTGLGALAYQLAAFVNAGESRWIWLLAATLGFCIYTNINLTGLHRFYRDRLMETFMPNPAAIQADGQAAESEADDRQLADFCGIDHDGPYHLINAHVVLLGARKARHRSRQGDSFLLSPLFCGSEATGFVDTRSWLPGPAWLGLARRHGPLALPTAMAISGAALNPRTAPDGRGMTKGAAVSALLTILNLRLGYWVPSPAKIEGKLLAAYRGPPNFIAPGLLQGLFGFRHNEKANWLELTDGGHFENTGLYELVRRRVQTIIFADGTTDPDIALSSFANALEKIYIDFNVTVTFPDQNLNFIRLLKGFGQQDDLAKRLDFSQAGFAVGVIHYPDGPPGTLFYVKSTMVKELPVALYSYKATNPLFPSESLADQFFSEQQFEAYRALGFALTGAMLKQMEGDPLRWAALGLRAKQQY